MCHDHALIMTPFYRRGGLLAAILLLAVAPAPAGFAQTSAAPSQPLITQPINPRNLVVLSGNTRPEATNPANDRGMVSDGMPLPHMLLQLRRPAAQEQALDALIDQLHDPNSPNYQHWLSPAEIGAQFGPAETDIGTVTGWLRQQGFAVNALYPNRMVIDFSGTAGQVRATFRTEIHYLSVNGVTHIANMSDPQIPAALAPAMVGIVSLNDFQPTPAAVHGNYTTNKGYYYVTPSDLATIYNFNPLFNAGISGQGQTIYLIENSDLYATSDWTTFRAAFGLSGYGEATLTTIHPNCDDPGTSGDDAEATLDAEYASAAAPNAALVMTTCAKSGGTPGYILAIENLLNGSSPPAIVNMSYIDCEENLGDTGNAALASAYQTGVAAGSSIFVSAGDEDAGACDYKAASVTHGITVNGLASTPYDVAVGGTDFADTYLGENSEYWNSSNSSTNGSAKSYIPEIPWNSTCGSQLTANYNGYSATYGSSGFCNSTLGETGDYSSDWGGSGGPSGCASGAPSIPEVVSGTCLGYPKPSWQRLLGNPADGVRDLPDVSMFAAFSPWKHGYIICFSDTSNGGVSPCTTSPSGWSYDWGGTSFAAPIWAGIQALINQYTRARHGNPNYRLYRLAAEEYGVIGNTCDSSKGNAVGSSCIFYDVTLGDDDAPCQADASNETYYNCYIPSGTFGVVSTANTAYAPAFVAAKGWDFATGIGTVNVTNLVTGWRRLSSPFPTAAAP